MPSQLHEALLLLFRNRPTLAPELIRNALHFELPAFTEARIDSADLTEVKPAEYHADLVVLLLDGVPVYGIVIEAQLTRDPRKKFVSPVYAMSLRARLAHRSRFSFSTTSGGGCILTLFSSRSARRRKGSYEPWIQPSMNTRAISPSSTSASAERKGRRAGALSCCNGS